MPLSPIASQGLKKTLLCVTWWSRQPLSGRALVSYWHPSSASWHWARTKGWQTCLTACLWQCTPPYQAQDWALNPIFYYPEPTLCLSFHLLETQAQVHVNNTTVPGSHLQNFKLLKLMKCNIPICHCFIWSHKYMVRAFLLLSWQILQIAFLSNQAFQMTSWQLPACINFCKCQSMLKWWELSLFIKKKKKTRHPSEYWCRFGISCTQLKFWEHTVGDTWV